MTLIKRNTNLFPAFPSLFDDFFGRDWAEMRNSLMGGSGLPAVNVKEEPAQFVLEVAAPGLQREDFKIEIDHRMLTISSQTENQTEEKAENGNYSRREFSYSAFSRSFALPESVNAEAITARYENGILYVHVPKREKAQVKPSRMIEIG